MQRQEDQQPKLPGGQASGQRNGQAVTRAGQGTGNAGDGVPLPAGEKVFRLPGAVVAWWAWVVFAVAGAADVAFSGWNHTAAEIVALLVLITGIMYACALRPRVIAGSGGITVQNPLRDHQVPWGSVTGVDLKESVRVHCARDPGAKRGKIIHCWALYAQRRSRLKAEFARAGDRRRLPLRSYGSGEGGSAEAQKLARQGTAEIMAAQLDELAKDAGHRGAAAGPRVVTWAWQPAAVIALPAVAAVLVVTVFR